MDFLTLNRLEFHAYHGVFDQEQLIGNTYYIDLKIGADFSKPCKTDNIEDTLNYASIVHEVQEEMRNNCRLIEHLAERICQRLKNQFQSIQSIEIKLTKQNPPLHGQLESVSIILSR